ncbi:MAG: hypothetical protein CXT64_04810 [Methanobacteriota archaeon]|nr:MAG: hypothetical protein CXT64_04810 [Euryarchaeota archaeon]
MEGAGVGRASHRSVRCNCEIEPADLSGERSGLIIAIVIAENQRQRAVLCRLPVNDLNERESQAGISAGFDVESVGDAVTIGVGDFRNIVDD